MSARIDADRETRTWPRVWLLAPAAAACVLALAVFVARENPAPTPAQTVQPSRRRARRGGGPQTRPPLPSRPRHYGSHAGGSDGSADRVRAGDRPAGQRGLRAAHASAHRPEPVDVSPLVVVMPIEMSTIAIDRIEIPAMP